MFLTILIFLLFGIALGVLFGLAPGIHPNFIILLVPVFLSFGAEPLALLALVVSMSVVNVLVDFIPSILLGAPDPETALSVLPGHRMLMNGDGYHAIKLAVAGGLISILFCVSLLPLLVVAIPGIYALSRPAIPFILIGFVGLMLYFSKKKILGAICFLLAGTIGFLSLNLPVDSVLILFPVFSGLFGLPILAMQMKSRTALPKQETRNVPLGGRTLAKPAVLGSLGGIASGILPGIGSSEIASLATIDKNNHSFLVTLGAITAANVLLSFLALWLIGNPRSGAAIAVEQFLTVSFSDVLFIVVVAVLSAAIGVIATLFLAKKTIAVIERIDYSLISRGIFALILLLIFYFTGLLGLFLAALCFCLGMLANLTEVKRGLLMGVLILPTVMFYLGI